MKLARVCTRTAIAALAFAAGLAAAVAVAGEAASRAQSTGAQLFVRQWQVKPDGTGLGPLYNAASCAECHPGGARAHPSGAGLFLRTGILPDDEKLLKALHAHRINTFDEPLYGSQLQTRAIPGHTREARIAITYRDVQRKLSDGTVIHLRAPAYTITGLLHGAMTPGRMTSPRLAGPLFGLGLIARIPAGTITKAADPDDRDGDGISGRANQVWSIQNNKVMPGRFGWKAGQPTIRQQIAVALVHDMGLSSPLFTTPGRPPEVTASELAALTRYTASLAARKPATTASPAALKNGAAMFASARCSACHRPRFTLKDGTAIAPYSDLLLHDMGRGLADIFIEGVANFWEWRTQPLWGIGARAATLKTYLHDGRARTILEAILWHGGEALQARLAVMDMTRAQRRDLIAFIKSL